MFKELLGDLFPVIEKCAPIIATAIGSPMAGSAAMLGLNLVRDAFNISSTTDPKEMANLIATHPDVEERLTQLESNYSGFFKSLLPKIPWPSKLQITIEWPQEAKDLGA